LEERVSEEALLENGDRTILKRRSKLKRDTTPRSVESVEGAVRRRIMETQCEPPKKRKDTFEIYEDLATDRLRAYERNKFYKRTETGDLRQVLALVCSFSSTVLYCCET